MAFTESERLQKSLMPPQKISLKQKGKEWREKCVTYCINMSSTANPWCNNPYRIMNYRKNVDVYEGQVDEEELKYITNPFNVEDKLPARLKDFNVVRPLIDSMMGEEINRPFKFYVCRTSEQADNEKQQELKERLINYCIAAVQANLDEQGAQAFEQGMQNGSIQPPEDILKWGNETYKDIAEEFCVNLLKFLTNKLELRTTFMRGYKDLLLNREEIYYVGEEYGKANVRWINPATFSYEYFPDMMYIEDATWCAERLVVSYAELHDRFKGDLTENDLDEILSRLDGHSGGSHRSLTKDPYQMDAYHQDLFNFTGLQWPFQSMSADCIEVWKVHWKSFRKIYFITLNDPETNHPHIEIVDENYVFTGDEEDVQEDWICQVWQGYKVAGDIFFGIRPISDCCDHNDPTSVKLPYVGLAAQGKSILELLKPMNTMYLSLWYRLELLLARDNGRVLNMDVTQIPKSMGLDIQKWAHMLKSLGVNLINPYESSWDIPGRDGTRPSAFNAFSSVDLSMSQSIGMYIDLITKVEQMAQQVIGFNPQRLGQVGHRDLAQTTQEALNQSYNTNALLVYTHDMVKQRVLRKLLNVSIHIRYRDDDDFLSFVGTDGMKVFLKMPQTALESMDLWVSSSAEEQKKLDELKNLYQPAMQNGATLVDVLTMMESDNLTTIRLKLQEIEMRKQQMMQQQEQAQQQQAQAQMEQVEKDRAVHMEQQNADRTLKKYMSDLENQTKIQIAEIQANSKREALDADGQINPIEVEKLELERTKFEGDLAAKQDASSQAIQKLSNEIMFKQQEMAMKQEEIAAQMAIKTQDAEAKRQSEYRKLELEQDKLKLEKERLGLEKDKLAEEVKKMNLEHQLEMKKLREEFLNEIKLAKMSEAHEVKMEKLGAAHEVKMEKMEEAHETKLEKMDDTQELKVARMEQAHESKMSKSDKDHEKAMSKSDKDHEKSMSKDDKAHEKSMSESKQKSESKTLSSKQDHEKSMKKDERDHAKKQSEADKAHQKSTTKDGQKHDKAMETHKSDEMMRRAEERSKNAEEREEKREEREEKPEEPMSLEDLFPLPEILGFDPSEQSMFGPGRSRIPPLFNENDEEGKKTKITIEIAK